MNFRELNDWFKKLKTAFDFYYQENLSNKDVSAVAEDLITMSLYISELAEDNVQQLDAEQKSRLQKEYTKLRTSYTQLNRTASNNVGAKLIGEALSAVHDEVLESVPTVHATLNEENKFRGAINIWLPIKYTDQFGVEHQGFFNQDHLDEQNKDFAINNEVRPGYMNKRNELTYELSKEFGLDNIVSKAISMNVIDDNNNKLSGTFMENAPGHDANHLSPDDPLWKCNTDEALSNPNFLKQLADIQAFDWICGNTDRSIPNTMYEIDERDPEHPVITGVHAIDHDSSFFASITKKGQGYLAAPSDMRVVSESMAENVKNMSDEKLRGILSSHSNITEEQINAAIIRKNELRDAILKAEKLEFGTPEYYQASFKIMPDEEWKNFKMSDMVDPAKFPHEQAVGREMPRNIFSRIHLFTGINPQRAKQNGIFRVEEGGKIIIFSDGQLITERTALTCENILDFYDVVTTNLAGLEKTDDGHKNSDEYTAILNASRELKNTMEDIFTRTEPGQNLSDDDMAKLREQFNGVHIFASAYSSMKGKVYSDMGKARQNACNQLLKLPFRDSDITSALNNLEHSPDYTPAVTQQKLEREVALKKDKVDQVLNGKREAIDQILETSNIENIRGLRLTNSTAYQNLLVSIDAYSSTNPQIADKLTENNSKQSQSEKLNDVRHKAVEYMFEKIKQHAKDDYKDSLKEIKDTDYSAKERAVSHFLENKSAEGQNAMFYGKDGAERFQMAASLYHKINELDGNKERIKVSFDEINEDVKNKDIKKTSAVRAEVKTTNYDKKK